LRQSLTEGKVLAGSFGELDHEVVRQDSGTGDDVLVELLEQGEAGFFRPAGDERELEQDEIVGVFPPEKRWRVQEAFTRKLMDDPEEVIRSES
jgi:hypothetical protein